MNEIILILAVANLSLLALGGFLIIFTIKIIKDEIKDEVKIVKFNSERLLNLGIKEELKELETKLILEIKELNNEVLNILNKIVDINSSQVESIKALSLSTNTLNRDVLKLIELLTSLSEALAKSRE